MLFAWLEVSAEDIHYLNNVEKGKATIVVTGNGTDTVGSKTVTFTIAAKSLKNMK